MPKNKNKIDEIISQLGGAVEVSAALGLHYQSVWQWSKRGGRIPQRYWKSLIDLAQEKGVPIKIEDFLAGAA